jgi:hypothetical protein
MKPPLTIVAMDKKGIKEKEEETEEREKEDREDEPSVSKIHVILSRNTCLKN